MLRQTISIESDMKIMARKEGKHMNTDKTRLTITLPVWLLDDLQEIAKVKGQSVNSLIAGASFGFLMKFKKNYQDLLGH